MVLESCSEMGIEPSRTIVIGDAVYDMQMARSAGAMAAGVSWGYHNRQGLIEAGAHHILEAPFELHALLQAMDEQVL